MDKLMKLARSVALKQPTEAYSMSDMETALRGEMAKLVLNEDGSINYHKWQQNHNMIFEVISTMVDAVLPKRFSEYGKDLFEVKTFADGSKPRFVVKKGRNNIKRFVTKVAAAGIYERVRMDRGYVDVDTYAHGGAVYQTLEGFLAGRENVSEFLEVLMEGLEEAGYADLTVMMQSIINHVPTANKHTMNTFEETEVDRVINTVRAYGQPTILCTLEFASTIMPTSGFVGDADKADMRNQGYIGKYKGTNVVIIPQSFVDETNTVKTVDPQFAYVVPAGSYEAPIKWALEGATKIRQVENDDWSIEFQVYKKMGMSLLNVNHVGIIKNTALAA